MTVAGITTYGILLFLHVAGAVLWLGTHAAVVGLRFLALRSRGRQTAAETVVATEPLGLWLIAPGVLLTLGAGFGLVHEGGWSYDALWIVAGLAGFALSNAIAGAIYPRDGRTLKEALAANDVERPETARALGRLQAVSVVDASVLLGVVFVMTVKP
jgi:uncharacterized membrane protein